MTAARPNLELNSRLTTLRELIVEASLEILDRDGLGLSADALSYRRVFAYIEQEHGLRVAGGSVQGRIWATHDDFRNEVLATAASQSSPYEDGRGLRDAIVHVLHLVDDLGLDHRSRVKAFCRIAGHTLFTGYLESDRFRRFQAIKGIARSSTDQAATSLLRSMIGEIVDNSQAELVPTFRFLVKALGLRAKQELRLDEAQAIGAAITLVQTLVTGGHLDHHGGFTPMASKVETGMPAEEDWPWSYFGIGFLAVMELLFELDPHRGPEPIDYQAAFDELAPPVPRDQRSDSLDPGANRPRRSREELRALVVAAGVDLLLQDGISLKANSLTYSSVFAHIKKTRGVTVHRSGVHRHIWWSQDEFRADVLAEAARYHTEESLTMARQAMAAQTVSHNPDGSLNYRQMILDSTRAIVTAQMLVSSNSVSFRRWQSIKAAMLSQDPEDHFAELRQAISDRYHELVSAFMENYRSVLPLVGLKVNPDMQMSEDQAYLAFAIGGAAFTSGADYNICAGATNPSSTIPLPRVDQSAESDHWPIQALASLALLDLLFVPQ